MLVWALLGSAVLLTLRSLESQGLQWPRSWWKKPVLSRVTHSKLGVEKPSVGLQESGKLDSFVFPWISLDRDGCFIGVNNKNL